MKAVHPILVALEHGFQQAIELHLVFKKDAEFPLGRMKLQLLIRGAAAAVSRMAVECITPADSPNAD